MMQTLKSTAVRSGALLMMCTAILLYGCTGLRPLTGRTVTLEAEKAASIFGENHHETFGVCDPLFLDRRGTRLYLWDEFVRQRDSAGPEGNVNHLAGYEVAITRGESCHLRIFETYQAAVKFDLSALPADAAVVSAQLDIRGSFAPFDPPRNRGNRTQCRVMLLGQATEPWEAGVFRSGYRMVRAHSYPPDPLALPPRRFMRLEAPPDSIWTSRKPSANGCAASGRITVSSSHPTAKG